MLFPLAHLSFARLLRRPLWTVVLGLPLAFNISYWYGFLPSFFALPLALLALALYLRMLRSQGAWCSVVGLALLSTATMLSHLVSFGALCVGMAALALTSDSRKRAVGLAALGLAPPLLLCAARVVTLVSRAFMPGDHTVPDYGWGSHFNWLLRNYRPEGVPRRRVPGVHHRGVRGGVPAPPARGASGSLGALPRPGGALPRDAQGALGRVAHPRAAARTRRSRRPRAGGPGAHRPALQGPVLLLVVASLAETARFHWSFKRRCEGWRR